MSGIIKNASIKSSCGSGDGVPTYVAVYVEPCDDFLSLSVCRLAWVVYDSNGYVLAEESHRAKKSAFSRGSNKSMGATTATATATTAASNSDADRPIGRLPPAFIRAIKSIPTDGRGCVAAHGMITAHLLLRRKFREVGMQGDWDAVRKVCTRDPELLRVAREDRAIATSGMELQQVYDLLTRAEDGGRVKGDGTADAAVSAAAGVAGKVSVTHDEAAATAASPAAEDDDEDDEALAQARQTGRVFFWYKNSPKHRHHCLEWRVEDYFVLEAGRGGYCGGYGKGYGGYGGCCMARRAKRTTRDWDDVTDASVGIADFESISAGSSPPPPLKRQFKRLPQDDDDNNTVPDDEMRRMTVETAAAAAAVVRVAAAVVSAAEKRREKAYAAPIGGER